MVLGVHGNELGVAAGAHVTQPEGAHPLHRHGRVEDHALLQVVSHVDGARVRQSVLLADETDAPAGDPQALRRDGGVPNRCAREEHIDPAVGQTTRQFREVEVDVDTDEARLGKPDRTSRAAPARSRGQSFSAVPAGMPRRSTQSRRPVLAIERTASACTSKGPTSVAKRSPAGVRSSTPPGPRSRTTTGWVLHNRTRSRRDVDHAVRQVEHSPPRNHQADAKWPRRAGRPCRHAIVMTPRIASSHVPRWKMPSATLSAPNLTVRTTAAPCRVIAAESCGHRAGGQPTLIACTTELL